MIQLHRLNGSVIVLNAELIESIESSPDTLVNLINGNKLIVKESIEQIRSMIVDYKKQIGLNIFDKEDVPPSDNK